MYTLDVLNRLNDINVDKDIKSLSHAVYPGTHCPLFGVVLTASYIKNMPLIVVGTNECTYYTKTFAYHRQHGKDKVYSVVLKENDVVFGAEKKVTKAVKKIVELEDAEAVMIVSTCVPELIGEDYSALSVELTDELNIPVFCVNTEHYSTNSHILGMKRALKSLTVAMDKPKWIEGVNILGHRHDNVENTELLEVLSRNGIKINTVIPSKCDLDSIKSASNAKLNIVTDMVAIDLAEEMKKLFGTEYIYFDKHMDKEIIEKNYRNLSDILELNLNLEIDKKIDEYNLLFKECSDIVKGMKLIYGNTPMMAFETVDFLSDLGMEPTFVQVRELYDQDKDFKENIANKGHNPHISRIANIAPLRKLYKDMKADVYIGHENPMLLRQNGLAQVTLDEHAQKIGFELPIGIMRTLIKLFDSESHPMKGGM